MSEKSMIVLANGQRLLIEPPTGERDSILNGRERKILPLVPLVAESEFDAVRAMFADPANTETMTLYYHEDNPELTDEQLEGSQHKVYEGFTIRGDWQENSVVLEPGTHNAPPEYGRKLTIEMGQRQYDEQ